MAAIRGWLAFAQNDLRRACNGSERIGLRDCRRRGARTFCRRSSGPTCKLAPTQGGSGTLLAAAHWIETSVVVSMDLGVEPAKVSQHSTVHVLRTLGAAHADVRSIVGSRSAKWSHASVAVDGFGSTRVSNGRKASAIDVASWYRRRKKSAAKLRAGRLRQVQAAWRGVEAGAGSTGGRVREGGTPSRGLQERRGRL